MARMWYYSSNNQQKGPVGWEELRGLAQAGQLRNADMVWQEGTPDWVRASQVQGLLNGASGDRVATDVRADEPAPRRRPARDDLDDDRRPARRPIRREQKSSKGLMIGLIAGGVSLVVIAIVVVIIIVANSGSNRRKEVAIVPPPPGGPPMPIVVPPGGKEFGGPLPAGRVVMASKVGTRLEDSITNLDPRDPVMNGFCKVYQVSLMPGRTYTIDHMQAGFKGGGFGFDPFLRLVDSRGMQVAADDDGGDGLNSRIVYSPPMADTYRIVCTTLGAGQTGNFTLMVREH